MGTYRSMSDQQLAELLRSGDEKAFAEIYERFFNVLFMHALRRLKDRDDAGDIMQELFSHLWSSRDKININSNLAGYLYSSVRNKVLNCLAKRKREIDFLTESIQTEPLAIESTDYLIREKMLAELIETEVQAMPPKMREVFELSRKHNYTHREIGEKLNLSEQSVRSHVKGALRLLRAKFHAVFLFLKLF